MMTVACPKCKQEFPVDLQGQRYSAWFKVTCDHCGVTKRLGAFESERHRQIEEATRKAEEDKIRVAEQVQRQSAAFEQARREEPATKQCPFCAETILAEARKCRFCGEMLEPPDRADGRLQPPVPPTTEEIIPFADETPSSAEENKPATSAASKPLRKRTFKERLIQIGQFQLWDENTPQGRRKVALILCPPVIVILGLGVFFTMRAIKEKNMKERRSEVQRSVSVLVDQTLLNQIPLLEQDGDYDKAFKLIDEAQSTLDSNSEFLKQDYRDRQIVRLQNAKTSLEKSKTDKTSRGYVIYDGLLITQDDARVRARKATLIKTLEEHSISISVQNALRIAGLSIEWVVVSWEPKDPGVMVRVRFGDEHSRQFFQSSSEADQASYADKILNVVMVELKSRKLLWSDYPSYYTVEVSQAGFLNPSYTRQYLAKGKATADAKSILEP